MTLIAKITWLAIERAGSRRDAGSSYPVGLPLAATRILDAAKGGHCPNRGCIMTVPSTPDQNSTVRYDPFTALPKTFGELGTWHAHRMAYVHSGKLRKPIDIESDDAARYILVRLQDNVTAHEIISGVAWQKLTNRCIDATGKRVQEINATGLSAMASVLRELVGAKQTGGSEGADAPKRSTERGEGRIKLIAALTKHHQYADGGCPNLEPIGNNKLARLAKVDRATASAFFKDQFGGHAKYKSICTDKTALIGALKLLNGEYTPGRLYGAIPPAENERDEG
jgi:hypothetical protein